MENYHTKEEISAKLGQERDRLDIELKQALTDNNDRKVAVLEIKRNKLTKKIGVLTDGICISDHALLRYMERVVGIDIEGIRTKLSNLIKDDNMGNGRYILKKGVYGVVKNKTLVTVMNDAVSVVGDNPFKGFVKRNKSHFNKHYK